MEFIRTYISTYVKLARRSNVKRCTLQVDEGIHIIALRMLSFRQVGLSPFFLLHRIPEPHCKSYLWN